MKKACWVRGLRRIFSLVRQISLAAIAAIFLVGATLPAAEEGARPFNVPAADAEISLRIFSEQSGQEIIYPSDSVRGIGTNAVRGEFTAWEAISRMLANTDLIAVQAAATGAIAVNHKPRLRPVVARDSTAASQANSQSRTEPEAPNDQRVVEMSTFEVRTTQGQGYSTTNASSAFKTNQPLLELPQSILVVTSDLIRDIGYDNSSDILQYAGVFPYFEGESLVIRGTRVTDPYLDGIQDQEPYVDPVFIDSYEIIRGPTAVLYPQTSLGGMVNKSSKKPLPFNQDIVTATVDGWGGWRTTLDFTGPLGKLGDGMLSYRLVALDQGGRQYFENVKNNRLALHPTLEWDYHNTTVYVAYDVQKMTIPVAGQALLTPSGNLYLGPGWGPDEDGQAPNNLMHQESTNWRASLTQKFSANWQMKFTAVHHTSQRTGGLLEADSIGYGTPLPTLTTTAVWADEWHDFWGLTGDFNGKYELGSLPNQSSFGFNETNWKIVQIYPTYENAAVTYTLPATEQALNSLYVPQQQDYTAAQVAGANGAGSRSTFLYDNIYYQHQLDVVPNWISLVAGWTYSYVGIVADSSLQPASPYNATDSGQSQFIHRYGAIIHLTKDAIAYALQSTMFQPGSSPLYDNSRGPNVQGASNEVGAKCAFWEGRISATVSAFKMSLTNQAILAPGLNVANLPYWIPIGSTTSQGVDGNIALQLVPQWDVIGTFYRGTVRDQTNQPVGSTAENSWTIFTRYKFGKESLLDGFAIGGGASKEGGSWISTDGITPPRGYVMPNLVKMHTGVEFDSFGDYAFGPHVLLTLRVINILNNHDPVGQQGVTFIDPSRPRTYLLGLTYKF